MINVENLHKSFGNVHAVDGVSFNVSRGEVVGLLGPNGAGKTTTMRVITGYLPGDSGSVKIHGIEVTTDSLEIKKCIGYLPENAPIYTDMEVTEYLVYIAKLRGIASAELRKSLSEMIETCGLGSVVGRPIGELSKGFKQRVGLAAAMIHKPLVLILDEPTSGLDPNQIVEIRSLIREIGKKRTVVLSTHIMQEVEATCSRALIISNGKLVGEGTIDELIRKGAAKGTYTISTRAARDHIEKELHKLPGMKIGKWLTEQNEEKQRCTLENGDGADRSEDIFRWAVASNITLSELSHEAISLEEVFRELTQNQ